MTSPPQPQPAELARLIREARKALDLTQVELAAATCGKVSYSYVRTIEAGRRADGHPLQISADVALALASALMLDEQEVLRLAGHPFNEAASRHQAVAAVNALPPHLRNAVTVIARALSSEQMGTDRQELIA
jgi:transcriptional regulator with XRE-family HTH domain